MTNQRKYDNSSSLLREYGERLRKGENPGPADYIARYSGKNIEDFKKNLKTQRSLARLAEVSRASEKNASKELTARIQTDIDNRIRTKITNSTI